MVYAVSSGLIEVLVSPIVEACPFENKASRMSLLHSFYCWGMVAMVLGSTLFFALFGLENWRILTLLWALVPFCNIFNFLSCPIQRLVENGAEMRPRQLIRLPLFWLLVLLMACSGAAENAMTQWASAFAESAIGVPKAVGDLAGPCLFAVFMGISRVLCAKAGPKAEPEKKYDDLRRAVCGLLSAGLPVAVPGFGADGLRPVRVFRGHYVAGNHQPLCPGLPEGRYGHVCLFGAGRRPGRHPGPPVRGLCLRAGGR